MRSRWLAVLRMAALFAAAAALPVRGAPGEPAGVPALCAFALVAVSGAAVAWYAWRAREWSPALIALAVFSVESSVFFRIAGWLSEAAPASRGPLVDLAGLALAGAWLALSTQPRRPTSGTGARRVRTLLLAGGVAVASMLAVVWLAPGGRPPVTLERLLVGGTVAMAVVAAGRFARAYTLMRTPAQGLLAAASLAAAGAAPATAGGLADGYAGSMLAAAAAVLLAVAFAVEAHSRPGLRTFVLGFFLTEAVARVSGERARLSSMRGLLAAIESHTSDLLGHVDRVAYMAYEFGHILGLDEAEVRSLTVAAQLHDVGKLFIPRQVLDNPGTPCIEEWQQLQKHAALGGGLLARIPALSPASRAVREHHERWDGTGYPDGKRGHEISLLARILTVTDVYDALTSARAYKQPWSSQAALAYLEERQGSHFDPAIVQDFVAVVRQSLGGHGGMVLPPPGESGTRCDCLGELDEDAA